MKRFLLSLAGTAVLALSGCCCDWCNCCSTCCNPCASPCGPTYAAPVTSAYAPYGTTATAAVVPMESLPTY